jgi:hypothetical protein
VGCQMLAATEEETGRVTEYMASQAPDEDVTFLQKMYSESILGHIHDVWDVHTNKERWWVITNPTNLYSQTQFPNMDYAVTFHVGLCIRIPRSEQQKASDLEVEPFAKCFRLIGEARDALSSAQEVADFQAVGVRCREMLLSFTEAAQKFIPWTSQGEAPKNADFKAWVDYICTVVLPRSAHEHRRALFKTLSDSAWKYVNWLTHAKHSTWHDAEAAVSVSENALSMCVTKVLQHMRGVPEQCPACGSFRLTPLQAINPKNVEELWERPSCTKCDWMGEPKLISDPLHEPSGEPPEGECIVPDVPLRKLERPE